MSARPSNTRAAGHDGPTAWIKYNCPFSFRFLLFLTEAGLVGEFDVVRCVPDDPGYEAMVAELTAGLGKKPGFPTVEVEEGIFMSDSGALIERYAAERGIDRAKLNTLRFYEEGVFVLVNDQYRENKALRAQLEAQGGS